MKAYNQRYSELTSKTRFLKKKKRVYTKSDRDNVYKNQKTS